MLSLRVENLSRYKNLDKEIDFKSIPIEVIGIKWQMGVQLVKNDNDNEIHIDIFYNAYSITKFVLHFSNLYSIFI